MTPIAIIGPISILLLLSLIGLLIFKKLQGRSIPLAAIVMLSVTALLMAGALSFVYRGEDYTAYRKLNWQPLAPAKIPTLVARGYTVFVDITANWCANCQVNKDAAIHRERVVNALSATNIVLMRGDWSQPNDLVENYLQQEAGLAVPYNKIYGPAAPDGIPLPRVLSMEDILAGLKYAGAAAHAN